MMIPTSWYVNVFLLICIPEIRFAFFFKILYPFFVIFCGNQCCLCHSFLFQYCFQVRDQCLINQFLDTAKGCRRATCSAGTKASTVPSTWTYSINLVKYSESMRSFARLRVGAEQQSFRERWTDSAWQKVGTSSIW